MRIGFFERFHQNHLGAAVNIGNEVVECFAVYFDGIQIAGGANHHCPALRAALKAVFKNGFMVFFLIQVKYALMRRTRHTRGC